MPFLIGIDEVGYGPKLGPLVITAVALRINNRSHNLWSILKDAVCKDVPSSNKKKIIVCDSKKLFSQRKGLKPLEETALPFINTIFNLPHYTYQSLIQKLNIACNNNFYPWYKSTLHLPLAISKSDLDERTYLLSNTLKKYNIKSLNIKINFIEPCYFNEEVTTLGNKSQFLFWQSMKLIHTLLNQYQDKEVILHIGKQGGRNFYLRDLVLSFPKAGVMILEEGKEISRYEIKQGRKKISISFVLDGEDKYFLIALASIIGKYIRELNMKLFNTYWQNKVMSLKPTAGYSPDANRFLQDIEFALSKVNLELQEFVRIK